MKNENLLIDLARDLTKARTDAELCRTLDVAPPMISRVRSAHLPIGPSLIIKLHEATGLAVREIKSYITHGPQQVVK